MNTDQSDIPESIIADYQKAYALVERGDFVNAVSILDRCVQACPDFIKARNELAFTLTKLEKADEALPHRFAVLELEPENLKYRVALINQLNELKRYSEALPLAEWLLQQNPQSPEHQDLVRRVRRLAEVGGIFVSYRSQDANGVRGISEFLLANNFDVWFAEYHVISLIYDQFNEDLNRELDLALSRCRTALVFTNDAWADSPYCQDEIRFISAHYPKERILQVCVPSKHSRPIEDWPILREVETTVCDFTSANSVRDLEQWLLDKLGVAIEDRRQSISTEDIGESVPLRDPYRGGDLGTLKTGPFERVNTPKWLQLTTLGDIQGLIEGSPNFTFRYRDLNLIVDVRPSRWVDDPGTSDDWAIYKNLRTIVRSGIERQAGSEEKGLHLFHWSGGGHLAITVRTAPFFGYYSWKRIYVIRVKNKEDRSIGEVNLNFSMSFPGRKPDPAAFLKFLSYLPLCDKIASSLEYRGYQSKRPLFRVRLISALVGAGLILLPLWIFYFWSAGFSNIVWIIAAVAGALFGLAVNQRIMVGGSSDKTAGTPDPGDEG